MSRTITTFIIDEKKPNGPRYYLINGHSCRMWVVPRADLDIVKEKDELNASAFYVLLGEDDDSKPKAYIGQTENFAARVKDHDYKKEFWNQALVFINPGEYLTTTDIRYLEYKGIALANKANTYLLDENKQIPTKPVIPEYQQAPMDDFFNDCLYLVSFIDLKLFTHINPKNEHLFYITEKGIHSKGIYNSDGLTVLKGSTIAKDSAPRLVKNKKELRANLIKNYTKEVNGVLTLTSDINFKSPSGASVFCLGSSTNGWNFWKDKDGKTLGELSRDKETKK